MSLVHTDKSFIASLIQLKEWHEEALWEIESRAAHHREQINQIDSLLTAIPNSKFSEPETLDLSFKSSSIEGTCSTETTQIRSEFGIAALLIYILEPQPEQATSSDNSKTQREIHSHASLPIKLGVIAPETIVETKVTRITVTKATSPLEKAKTAHSRASLPMLPKFGGLTKLEAIAKVLAEQSGEALHQNSLIQILYGDLSPVALNQEIRRMRASLMQGIRKGLWQKAPKQPSSFLAEANKGSKTKEIPKSAIFVSPKIEDPSIFLDIPVIPKVPTPGNSTNLKQTRKSSPSIKAKRVIEKESSSNHSPPKSPKRGGLELFKAAQIWSAGGRIQSSPDSLDRH